MAATDPAEIIIGPLEIWLGTPTVLEEPDLDQNLEELYNFITYVGFSANAIADFDQGTIDGLTEGTSPGIAADIDLDGSAPISATNTGYIVFPYRRGDAVELAVDPTGYIKTTVTVKSITYTVYSVLNTGQSDRSISAALITGPTSWQKFGRSGVDSYDEPGITLTHSQTTRKSYTAGSTGPKKATRTQEELSIGVDLKDLSLENYTFLINDLGVRKGTSGGVNVRRLSVRRGIQVQDYSLIARGIGLSPYGADKDIQFYCPRCYADGEPSPQFSKDGDSMLNAEFMALEDLNQTNPEDRFGWWTMEE